MCVESCVENIVSDDVSDLVSDCVAVSNYRLTFVSMIRLGRAVAHGLRDSLSI